MNLSSPAFQEGKPIPPVYTGDGADVSPPLRWTEPPAGTESLALICDDPDAPGHRWVHWVLFNLPPSARELPENARGRALMPAQAIEGKNDFGRSGYGGPLPPSGTHRYFFTLHALDIRLPERTSMTAWELLKSMTGHVLARATVMGTYAAGARRGTAIRRTPSS